MGEERKFTFEDAVLCAQKYNGTLYDVDLTKRAANAHCPYANHKTSKKLYINFDKGYFNCPKCSSQNGSGKGGSPVSLFMHVTGISDKTEAARTMHALLGDEAVNTRPAPAPEKKPDVNVYDAADLSVRHSTYSALLDLLVLTDSHRTQLRNRGLSDKQIDLFGYKSLPGDPKEVSKKLLQKGCVLEGVPGFFKDKEGRWTMNIFGTGIFVPFRNAREQIQFMQIRSDKKPALCKNCDHYLKGGTCSCEDGPRIGESIKRDDSCPSFKERGDRYFAFSSPNKEAGCGAKTWIHARKGWKAEGWKEVYITEGALKADVASCLSGKNFLAVAGVKNIGDLPRALRDLTLSGLEKVYLCYDMDKDRNAAVLEGEQKIGEMLEVLRIPYEILEWEGAKCIDDWLAENKIK